MERPLPPLRLRMQGDKFRPAPEVHHFIHEVFVSPDGPFHREEYAHLEEAQIGVF